MTKQERRLIDKLIHTENKNEIIDIVKKLVPEATNFTANRYAYYTEFYADSLFDKFMDIESKVLRKNFLKDNCSEYGADFCNDMLNLIPYIPLNEDERLYRPRHLTKYVPSPKNKNLIRDIEYTSDVDKYIFQAMCDNHELDRNAAEELVLSEIEKNSARITSTNTYEPTENADIDFMFICLTETNYIKRMNFFERKLNPGISDEEIRDNNYQYILENIKEIVEPNYTIKSIIAVDFHIKMLKDMYNEN